MNQTTTIRAISSRKFIPEHLSSPPVFSGVYVARSIFFCEVFCIYIVFCPVVIFLLAIVLYVLRFQDYDYPFAIFKLFLLYIIFINVYLNNLVFALFR